MYTPISNFLLRKFTMQKKNQKIAYAIIIDINHTYVKARKYVFWDSWLHRKDRGL